MDINIVSAMHKLYFRLMTLEKQMTDDERFSGLSVMQVHMIMLVDKQPMTMKDLTGYLCISKGPLSLLVKKLYKQDYIWREPNLKDGRSVLIGTTAKGRSIARIHDMMHFAAIKVLTAALSNKEKEQLTDIFSKLDFKTLSPSLPVPVPSLENPHLT